jgi:hypothetical protein
MTDLTTRFHTVDELDPPDLWARIGSGRDHVASPVIDATSVDSTGRRVRAGAVALAVFVTASVFAWTALRPEARMPSARPLGPPPWVVDKARSMAAGYGDASPTSAEWVLTTADAAPSVTEGTASHAQLYLVVLGGHFTGNRAPAAGALPSGTVLAFTLDPISYQVEDVSLGSRAIVVPGLKPFRIVPDPSTSTNYIFTDITVQAGYAPPGRPTDPTKATVTYRYAWSGDAYPGDHQCSATVFDAAGAEIGRLPTQFISQLPQARGPQELGVPVNGVPSTASIVCDSERLDTPIAYSISDERVIGVTMRSDGEAAIKYSFHLGWPVELPAYPGVNACTEELIDANGAAVSHNRVDYSSPPRTITAEVVPDDPRALDQVTSLTLHVECHPWTAADMVSDGE